MSNLDWRVVSIQVWPGQETAVRREHPFRGGGRDRWGGNAHGVNWGETTSLLRRELDRLNASSIRLQMWVTDRDIRNDGWIRADARPTSPGVILSFDSKHGPLSYPCDTFTDWRGNVRAIAVALESLRRVDRYGVSSRGEQYTGWKQIPPVTGISVERDPYEVLAECSVLTIEGVKTHPAKARRRALANAHPDGGGSSEAFAEVQSALLRIGM